jgi:hypothetical protein
MGIPPNIAMRTLILRPMGGNEPECFPEVTLVEFFHQHVPNLRREKPKNARMLRQTFSCGTLAF